MARAAFPACLQRASHASRMKKYDLFSPRYRRPWRAGPGASFRERNPTASWCSRDLRSCLQGRLHRRLAPRFVVLLSPRFAGQEDDETCIVDERSKERWRNAHQESWFYRAICSYDAPGTVLNNMRPAPVRALPRD